MTSAKDQMLASALGLAMHEAGLKELVMEPAHRQAFDRDYNVRIEIRGGTVVVTLTKRSLVLRPEPMDIVGMTGRGN